MRCDFCGGNNHNGHCSAPSDGQQEEEAHYLQNQARPQQKFQGSYQGYRGGLSSNQLYGWRPQNSNPTNTSFVGPSIATLTEVFQIGVYNNSKLNQIEYQIWKII